jgi:eukaryotic-like serine/threonine-protein kinase
MTKPMPTETARTRPEGAGGRDDPARRLWALWRQGHRPRLEDFLAQAGALDAGQLLEVLLVDQAERFRLGQGVAAETYLDAFPPVRDDPEAAIDLVFAEYLLREEMGEAPAPDEYLGRFPQHAVALKLQLGLHRAMATQHGPSVDHAEPTGVLDDRGPSEPTAVPEGFPVLPGYEILGVLGSGGMAVVYRAWQKRLNRTVAVKMVLAGAHASPAVLERFRIEAEAVARLQHPNIVQIHDVGHHAGSPYLVLELVEGDNLAERVAGTPQPVAWVAQRVETLARAIHAAHRQGVVHRDLTPANILLAAEDVPKVTDFGLAKLIDGGLRTVTGELLGTPSYMAPEQAAGRHREVGAAADVYALGAILYELLTGRPPFKAESSLETLRQVASDEPVPPARLRPNLPRDLETICLACLRKEPARRYSSALVLAEDLRRFLDGRPILARRSGTFERAWMWCRRNPRLATASITAALLMIIVAIGSPIVAWKVSLQRDEIRDALLQARGLAGRERRALADARDALFHSLIDQVQARRYSRQAGQRVESLKALGEAATIARELGLPDDRLRDEAIACLALPDLEPVGRLITLPPRCINVVFAPTMTRYALRFRDGTISVRHAADDHELAQFRARGDQKVGVLAFSPDGRHLAALNQPGASLSVWDVERRADVLNDPGPISGWSAFAFAPDGRRLVLAHRDGEVLVYDLATRRIIARRPGPGPAQVLAIRGDGDRIAVLDAEKSPACRILETETGQLVRKIPLPAAGNHLAWSPDGASLATTGSDRKIYLWDVATGIRTATVEGFVNDGVRTAFHPAGTLLASTGWEHRISLSDPVLGRPWLRLAGDTDLVFSPEGHLSVFRDDQLITYRVDPPREYRTFAPLADRRVDYGKIAIRGDGRVALYDQAHGSPVGYLAIGKVGPLFEASGDLLTSGVAGAWRWPVRLDPERREYRIGPPSRLRLPAGLEDFSADRTGRIVALAYGDRAYVQTPGRTLTLAPLQDARGIAVSPDGAWVATGSHGKNGFQVWRTRDASPVADRNIEGLVRVAFSPDGKWLMTKGPPCRLWAVGTWDEARRIDGEGRCFSPDSRLVAVQDARMVIRLVEAATGRTLARLESPDPYQIDSAAFSPDGVRLVVSTNDGPAVHVWDLRAIRGRLAAMGLDWDAPAYPDEDPAASTLPPLPAVQIDYGPLTEHLQHYAESPQVLVERYTARITKDARDADAYHHRAHALEALRRSPEAVDDFTRAIGLRPQDAHLREARAHVHTRPTRDEAAIGDLETALALEPDRPFVREELAELCNDRSWELATGTGPRRDLAGALALARRAVELVPGDVIGLNTLGVAQYRAGRYDAAITTFEHSLAAGRGRIDAYDLFFLAMAHHRLGRAEQARDAFDRAVRWCREQKSLPAGYADELAGFRAEAEAVLAGPAGVFPEDVFAGPDEFHAVD